MDFLSDANADFEGLSDVNREICMHWMAEKTSLDTPKNCAARLKLPFYSPFSPCGA